MPTSSPPANLAAASAAAVPVATPTAVSSIPWRTTSPTTSRGPAPSAMRIPNSRFRWLTANASTLYSPIAASSSDTVPSTPSSVAATFCGYSAPPM